MLENGEKTWWSYNLELFPSGIAVTIYKLKLQQKQNLKISFNFLSQKHDVSNYFFNGSHLLECNFVRTRRYNVA